MGVNAFMHYEVGGPAEPGRVRWAGLIDLGAALVVTMIVFPQPFVRAAITSAGLPIMLFIGSMLGAVVLAQLLYLAFSVVMWGRTLGMYLLDLGLAAESKPTLREALGFSAGWVLAGIPALLGIRAVFDPERGWPAALGGVPTRSTLTVRPTSKEHE